MTSPFVEINKRRIGPGCPTYVVAELSANHRQDFAEAAKLVKAAKEAGADAVKLQTYTPDTMTIPCTNEYFRIRGTAWDGRTLHDLYGEAYTPWEWHGDLKQIAEGVGLDLFSTPFDATAVEFLERLEVPAYKIASFEIVDVPLIECVARTGKPMIISTGMATLAEIEEAVRVARDAGAREIVLLKCTSAYPAPAAAMHLRTLPHLADAFHTPVGLSDHTLGITVPVAAVALGARVVEKHFTLDRSAGGPDSGFSLEPHEFGAMVDAIRTAEQALGDVHYGGGSAEADSRIFRRSLFVVKDIKAGETFTEEHVRSIRPGFGLHTRHLGEVIGRCASRDISRGTPLVWGMVSA
jgi:N-acetylneuraminate synthase